MKKIKAIRKIYKKFQSVGTRFKPDDLVIINGNEFYHIFINPQRNDSTPFSAYRYENVDDFQIEKILDNSQDDEYN